MSPSLEKQYVGEMVISPQEREEFFRAVGEYGSDIQVHNWLKAIGTSSKSVHNTDGSKTSFYNIPDWVKDVDDLAEHWNLKGDEFNCLKAIAGIALGSRHSGTSPIRDAKKLQHYSSRIVARLEKDSK